MDVNAYFYLAALVAVVFALPFLLLARRHYNAARVITKEQFDREIKMRDQRDELRRSLATFKTDARKGLDTRRHTILAGREVQR